MGGPGSTTKNVSISQRQIELMNAWRERGLSDEYMTLFGESLEPNRLEQLSNYLAQNYDWEKKTWKEKPLWSVEAIRGRLADPNRAAINPAQAAADVNPETAVPGVTPTPPGSAVTPTTNSDDVARAAFFGKMATLQRMKAKGGYWGTQREVHSTTSPTVARPELTPKKYVPVEIRPTNRRVKPIEAEPLLDTRKNLQLQKMRLQKTLLPR